MVGPLHHAAALLGARRQDPAGMGKGGCITGCNCINGSTAPPAQLHRSGPATPSPPRPIFAPVQVTSRAHKMSKSRGNVINPDDIVWQYGADSLRLYEMFMGPLRDTKVCGAVHPKWKSGVKCWW